MRKEMIFMRTYYVRFSLSNGYCGCRREDYVKHIVENDDISQSAIDEHIQEWFENEMYEYLETYEYVATGWGEDWESEEDREAYYQGEYCNWEYITEEEYHEGRRNNGEEE